MSDRDQAAIRREIAARRRAQAFQMRREGASFEAIGNRIGVTRSQAHKMVTREVRLLAGETDVEEHRQLHVEALMDLWRAFHGAAAEGDVAAADRFLRVEERLSRLLGLDHAAAPDAEPPPPPATAATPDAGADRRRRFRRSSDLVEVGEAAPVEDAQ